MLLGTFHRHTKLDAKRAEMVQLMQKFVPRSRVGFFHNECSRSTPLEPELMFWCVSYTLGAFGIVSLTYKTRCVLYSLGAFGTVSLPYQTWCKKGRNCAIDAKVRATKFCQIFSQLTLPINPLDSKLMFWCVSYCLVLFGTVSLP